MSAAGSNGGAAGIDAKRLGQRESGDSSLARLASLREGDTVRVRLQRFDPSRDEAPYMESYEVPYTKLMRVLDVLNYIAEDLEEDLAYRWYCGVKKCGTCAVRVNGREVLSCWEAAEPDMVIEPLRHAPVIRDTVVDREPYEERIKRMTPWLERATPYPGFPERLSHRDMGGVVHALNCLSCMCCLSACPVLDLGDETDFAGPAILVQFAQQALDPRDSMDRGRIALEEGSIFDCVSCYRCEEACPVGIPIVSAIIEPLKAIAYRSMPARAGHAGAFLDIIEGRGRIDPSALVLKVQGWSVLLRSPGRTLKLLLRGKINPLKTFFGGAAKGAAEVRRLIDRTRDWKP